MPVYICACVRRCCQPAETKEGPRGRDWRYRRRQKLTLRGGGRGNWHKKSEETGKERVRWWRGGAGGLYPSSLVGSQEHRSVRWEHTVCTPVQTSWPPLPALVVASPSDTPPRSARRGRVCGGEVQLLRQAGKRAGRAAASVLYEKVKVRLPVWFVLKLRLRPNKHGRVPHIQFFYF